MGFSLEGWMYFPQLPELADFARAVPDLTIILNILAAYCGSDLTATGTTR